jgi:hypothetical protein
MSSLLILSYRRMGDGYEYELNGAEAPKKGSDASFADVINVVSEVLRVSPDVELIFRRTDHAGLRDLTIDTVMRDLIRNNPAQYIAETTVSERKVVVRDRPTEETQQYATPYIRSGYDTLAESFGERLYVRIRDDGKVECPLCGRWTAEIHEDSIVPMLRCQCNATGVPGDLAGCWFAVTTEVLVTVKFLGRYYIPRLWNPNGWISCDELTKMYLSYLKEIEHV